MLNQEDDKKEKPSAEELVDEIKGVPKEKPKVKTDFKKTEELYEELKKKGTLRSETAKKKDDVPSAHELLARKKKQNL